MPAWRYTLVSITLATAQDGSGVARHWGLVLRDGIEVATLRHTEVVNGTADPPRRPTYFDRYLARLLNRLGRDGWEVVDLTYGSPTRVLLRQPAPAGWAIGAVADAARALAGLIGPRLPTR
jgi:hypothetical protein